MHMKGFTVRAERCQPRTDAQSPGKIDEVEEQGRFVEAGEGVLHQDDAVGAFPCAQGAERLGGRGHDATPLELGCDIHLGQFGRCDEANRT